MDISFADIISTLGSAFFGLVARMFWGTVLGIVAALTTLSFVKKMQLKLDQKQKQAPAANTDEVTEYCHQDSKLKTNLCKCLLIVLGFLCGCVGGTSAGLRHVYRVTIEESSAVQSRIDDASYMLADFLYLIDFAVIKGEVSSTIRGEALDQWRDNKTKLRPKDLCDRLQSATDSIDGLVRNALDWLPIETAGLAARFIPTNHLKETVETAFGDRTTDTMNRDESAKALRYSLIEDGITASVSRKTNTFIYVPMMIFLCVAFIVAWPTLKRYRELQLSARQL